MSRLRTLPVAVATLAIFATNASAQAGLTSNGATVSLSAAKANKSPYWNAVTNNCNHFIGELAQAVGLKVPGQFQVSYAFVPALKELNEGAVAGTGKSSGQHRAVATPRS